MELLRRITDSIFFINIKGHFYFYYFCFFPELYNDISAYFFELFKYLCFRKKIFVLFLTQNFQKSYFLLNLEHFAGI